MDTSTVLRNHMTLCINDVANQVDMTREQYNEELDLFITKVKEKTSHHAFRREFERHGMNLMQLEIRETLLTRLHLLMVQAVDFNQLHSQIQFHCDEVKTELVHHDNLVNRVTSYGKTVVNIMSENVYRYCVLEFFNNTLTPLLKRVEQLLAMNISTLNERNNGDDKNSNTANETQSNTSSES